MRTMATSSIDEIRPRQVPAINLYALSLQFRHILFVDLLPLWATVGADWREGGFREAINRRGQIDPATRRIRVSARQVYVFCEAERLGWNSAAAIACVRHGLDFLDRHRNSKGLLFQRLTEGNTLEDREHDLYDQAFLLLAYAHAYRLLRDKQIQEKALRLLGAMREELGHDGRGFRDHTAVPFPLRSNPHMHLFEAMLAWMTVDGDPSWREMADEISFLFRAHFFEPGHGVVREQFERDWSAHPSRHGYLVEPGHNYEWAWLVIRWNALTGADTLGEAIKMATFAERYGYRSDRHVAVNSVWTDGSIGDGRARLWPQTERLKAWLALAAMSSGAERELYEERAGDAARSLMAYFDDETLGIWHDMMLDDGKFEQGPAPASSLYHIMCAVSELFHYVEHHSQGQAGSYIPAFFKRQDAGVVL